MASVQDLSSALVKADAAGDTAGAKVLADAIRQQQSLGAQLPGAATATAPPQPAQPLAAAPSFVGSALSTLNHGVTDLPIIGAPLKWLSDNALAQTVGRMQGQDPATWLQHAQASADANDAANPIAKVAGALGGNVAATAATAGANGGAEALGFAGKLLPSIENGSLKLGQIGSSLASQLGIGTVDNMEQGQAPTQAMGNAAGPALVAGAAPVAGAAVGKLAQGGMDAVNGMRQGAATNAAIAGAPTAQGLKDAASKAFDSATGGTPIAISDNAYMRFLGDVRNGVEKYRPNDLNNPEAVGILRKLWDTADAVNAPGSNTVVDLKDLHILRQAAGGVANNAPDAQTRTIAGVVVNKMDNFINGLKPSDVVGGQDPTQAASDLMAGISGWHRGILAGKVESAITKADTYKTGMENGLKASFSNLMRDPDYQQFSPQAQSAIRQVAKGTPVQNAMAMLGKMGFSPGGGASHNIIGGTIGAGFGGAALAPVLGPLAPAAGIGASMAASAAGRAAAERMATNSATRAAQVVATPNIPTVAPMQLPQLMQGAQPGLQMLLRAAMMGQGAPAQ